MSFFDLPDRQVVYLLDYLRTKLRGDVNAKQWFDASDNVVDGTLARNPKQLAVYKGEYVWKLHSASLPYLALWRTKNGADREAGMTRTRAYGGIGWFGRLPGGCDEHDAETWGMTFASNMWHVCKEHLEEIPLETRRLAACGSVFLGDGEIDVDIQGMICGFIAPLTVMHTKPPYEIEDPEAFTKAILKIKLYDSSQDDVDGLPGKYLGFTQEAEIDIDQT